MPRNEVSPAGNEVSPAGNEVSPAGNEVSPAGNEVSPAGNEVSPAGNEVSPPGNEVSPPSRRCRRRRSLRPPPRAPLPKLLDVNLVNDRFLRACRREPVDRTPV